MDSEVSVQRVMPPTWKIYSKLSNIRLEFLHTSSERWTFFLVFDCIFVRKHHARLHLDKFQFWSRAPLMQEEGFQIYVYRFTSRALASAEESQHKIWCVVSFVSSALHPNFNNQVHCCCKSMPSEAPQSAKTQLSFTTAECDRRDAVPLTVNRSASAAKTESPYVNTEPSGTLFASSRSRCPSTPLS